MKNDLTISTDKIHILGQILTIADTILYLQKKRISLQAEYDKLEKKAK